MPPPCRAPPIPLLLLQRIVVGEVTEPGVLPVNNVQMSMQDWEAADLTADFQ